MNNNVKILKKVIPEIKKTKLFDENYYQKQFEYKLNMNPLVHYLNIGYKEGKSPSENFDTKFYLEEYDDVKRSGINPLVHYILHGRDEKRKINKKDAFNNVNSRMINRETFNKMLEKDIYFKNRWSYINDVLIEIAKLNAFNILEIGPHKLPLIKMEDVIDISDSFKNEYPININKFIKHDCSKVPYPIKDKEYDLVIACQVLEHLGITGEQKVIFDELERISEKAVITLPYKWFNPDMRDHHMIDKKVIEHWAQGREPIYEKITNHRILQIYEFD